MDPELFAHHLNAAKITTLKKDIEIWCIKTC